MSKLESQKKKVENILGPSGRLLSMSKSIYRHNHKNHLVLFNAVLTTKDNFLWKGDVNVTEEEKALMQLAEAIGETLYVNYEGSFLGNDPSAVPELTHHAAVKFEVGEGKASLTEVGVDLKSMMKRNKEGLLVFKQQRESTKQKNERIEKEKARYKEEDYTGTIDLPNLESFLDKKSKDDPLSKFWDFILSKLPEAPNGKRYSVNVVTMHSHDYEELKNLLTKWAKHKHKGLHKVKLAQSVSFTLFGHGPNSFFKDADPDFAERGKVYIGKRIFE